MKRNLLACLPAVALMTAITVVPLPAPADQPAYWEVVCEDPDIAIPSSDFFRAYSPQEVGDKIALCHAAGGHVRGVEVHL